MEKVPGSIWENSSSPDGIFRVISCPRGYALTRIEGMPQGDDCVKCPEGSYNIEGSQWLDSQQNQSGTRAPPAGFCLRCPPVGAYCPGGHVVEALEGYFSYETESGRRRDGNTSKSLLIKMYQCPVDACDGNNTCKVCSF